MSIIILIFLMSGAVACAEENVPVTAGTPTTATLLYDHATGSLKPAHGACQSERLYVRYSSLGQWSYVRCEQGTFLNPAEIICDGTVVAGIAIGAKEPTENFELIAGRWVKSLRKEKKILLVLAPRPLERTTTFFSLDKEGNLPLAGMPVPVATLRRRR